MASNITVKKASKRQASVDLSDPESRKAYQRRALELSKVFHEMAEHVVDPDEQDSSRKAIAAKIDFHFEKFWGKDPVNLARAAFLDALKAALSTQGHYRVILALAKKKLNQSLSNEEERLLASKNDEVRSIIDHLSGPRDARTIDGHTGIERETSDSEFWEMRASVAAAYNPEHEVMRGEFLRRYPEYARMLDRGIVKRALADFAKSPGRQKSSHKVPDKWKEVAAVMEKIGLGGIDAAALSLVWNDWEKKGRREWVHRTAEFLRVSNS